MARDGYIELAIPADADPTALLARFTAGIQDAVPGWQPADGDIVVRIGDGTSEMAADREAMAIDVSRELFRTLGGELFGVEPLEETAATATVTWTVNTSTTVLAGVQVTIDGVAFEVTEDTAVATSGTVPIAALIAGASGTGITGTVDVLDAEALIYTTSVVLDAATTGGRDAEADDVYEDRLAARIAHLGRPVLPADFSDRARDITGVYRALTIDNYKPADLPTPGDAADDEAERTVTVVPVDEAGADVSGGVKTSLDAYLQAERELNFVVYVIDPTRTAINVTATVTVWDGYTPADVNAQAEAAIAAFLDPSRWGTVPFGEEPVWYDTTVIDKGSLEAAILAVTGVRRVVSIDIVYFDDSFTGDLSAYTEDAGSGTWTPSGGQLVPSSTAEKRIVRTGLLALNPRGLVEYATGATVGASGVVGLILKRLDDDDYLFVRWATADGKLAVRKSVAGTTSTIADSGSITLSANTTYWLRGWIDGNAVTVEHWTTNPALGGTPAATFTYTLTGGDATTYGDGISGGIGLRVQPGATTWRYNSLKFDSVDDDLELVGPAPLPTLAAATVTEAS